jgi:hypothetical protein
MVIPVAGVAILLKLCRVMIYGAILIVVNMYGNTYILP